MLTQHQHIIPLTFKINESPNLFYPKSIRTEEDIDFECQHGEDECAGNAIQSCALNSLPDQDKQVEFVSCQMTFGSEPTGQTVTQE